MPNHQLNLPPCPLPSSERRAQTAKASLRKADNDWVVLGHCIEEVQGTLTLEEFAYALKKDSRQVARWIAGTERPQIEALFAVERFRAPLLVAMARLSDQIEIETTIRVRRIA